MIETEQQHYTERRRVGRDPRGELVRLLLVVLAVIAGAVVTHTTDVLIVIAALIIMIMVHELGHFATAKWSHMKVTEYFLGFGPRLWSIKRGETEYGVKALPLGGYVKILGMSSTEEVDPEDEPRTYRQQPFHNRLMVAVAGSFMHAVMAFLLVFVFFTVSGIPSNSLIEVQAIAPLAHNVDPARTAGVRTGDIVVSADGKKITSFTALQKVIQAHPGSPVTLVVLRGGKHVTLVAVPAAETVNGKSVGQVGVVLTNGSNHVNPITATGHSFVALGDTVTASLSALGQRFSPHGLAQYWHQLTNNNAANASEHSNTRIQSIYGAVRTAAQGVQAGWGALVAVLVSINVFVGIFNLLPMLPLDGGHVVIAVYEKIRSRRGTRYWADVTKMAPVAYAFLLFLGFIVISATYLDITHPVANPFH